MPWRTRMTLGEYPPLDGDVHLLDAAAQGSAARRAGSEEVPGKQGDERRCGGDDGDVDSSHLRSPAGRIATSMP